MLVKDTNGTGRQLSKLRQYLSAINIGDQPLIIIMAFIIGLLAGAVNVLFRTVMNFSHEIIFEGGTSLLHIGAGGYYKVFLPLLPMAGAFLLIPLSLLFPGEVNGYGFSKFLEIVNIRGGVIKARNIFIKTLGPALTIGAGGSAGVEGPIAFIGGTVGSLIGQFMDASENRMKLLIASGAAGAIAATFNAPIAGIMFAIEIVLLGNYELSSFSAIVVSSGIATVVSRGFYGESPAFSVPQYNLRSPLEIPFYIVFGVLIGILAVFYIRIFHRIKDEFDAFRLHPQLKPVLGAFIVGAIGIFLPQIMGNGYNFIEEALAGRIIFPIIILLVFFKVIATSVTLGSGGAGGVFAPALFIGAMAGGSFGHLVHYLFPSQTASPEAYATVGIGAFLAAATHAPLTGIFLLFEMTGNYKIIIPLMFSAIIGTLVARKLYPDSIDTVDLTKRGISIHSGREVSIMSRISVGELMDRNFTAVPEDMLLKDLIDLMIRKDRFYFPVIGESGEMIGIVSVQDVRPALFEEEVKNVVTAGEVATEKVIVLRQHQDLNAAMNAFSRKDIEEIPVVSENDPRKVIAMIRRKDLIDAYNREVLKSGE
ncbi:MAG: chloride channel protein [Nitrospiraceae bacterium]|nr:chloride channel protein [Nitrospiraceae bacterium]